MTIKNLLAKHDIKHGIENDQARLDEFTKDLKVELARSQHFDPVTLEWYIPASNVAFLFDTSVEKLFKENKRG
jgi:hypothetical protein